ncbi:MAG TPA: hypothetical protein VNJ03_08465 [Vicinamibacterales bacterium]|nr:hypothetical protein [Vicinamibacterales bacterium]
MSKSADAVRNGLVLRIAFPATGDLRDIADAVTANVAEQLGVEGQGTRLGEALDDLARRLEPAADGDIAFEFHKLDRELKIEARSGDRTLEARVPLSA